MAAATGGRDVFVNCPFDPDYQPLLDAVVFGIAACGYRVRSALEVQDSGDLRLAKIIRLIEQSPLSIHDLSRVQIDRATDLPRFNMPIEMGIALGMKHLGRKVLRDHKMLVLDSEPYRYRAFASDLAGLDIVAHGNTTAKVIGAVRNFLDTHSASPLPTPDVLEALYDSFETELPRLAGLVQQSVQQLSFRDRMRHVVTFLEGAA